MFPWRAVVVVLFVIGTQYFIEYRDWVDWNKKDVLKIAPGPCITMLKGGGSEDLLRIGNNTILISQGINVDFEPGQLSFLDLDTNSVTKANITNAPDWADFLAACHGLTSWTDPKTGQLFVYVLTHPESEDRIEVFEVSNSLILTYIRSITDPSFTFMDDLVAVGRDQFYITSIWRWRHKAYITAETWMRLYNGRIVYYDGHKGREVATGYYMADGINISPDMSTIYMAETGCKAIHAFKRDESNNLHHLWAYTTPAGPDNIDVDPVTGDLWIGSIPIMWMTFDFYKVFGDVTPRSQVIRMKLRDNMVSEIEEIYSDNGSEIAGSSVAAYVNGKLVIGSVYSTAVVCDVKYLSP